MATAPGSCIIAQHSIKLCRAEHPTLGSVKTQHTPTQAERFLLQSRGSDPRIPPGLDPRIPPVPG